jgi:hypothetical protein
LESIDPDICPFNQGVNKLRGHVWTTSALQGEFGLNVTSVGCGLMDLDIRSPFYIAAAAAALGLLLMALTWGTPAIRRLTTRPGEL